MLVYPQARLWQEVAWLATRTGWSLDDLLDLPHRHRVRLVQMVAGFDEGGRR